MLNASYGHGVLLPRLKKCHRSKTEVEIKKRDASNFPYIETNNSIRSMVSQNYLLFDGFFLQK